MAYRLKDNVKEEDLLKIGFKKWELEDNCYLFGGDGIDVNIKTKEVNIPSYRDMYIEVLEVVDCIYLLTKNNLITNDLITGDDNNG